MTGPYRLTRRHKDGGATDRFYYGETAEAEAWKGWKETRTHGSRLYRLNQDVWESIAISDD